MRWLWILGCFYGPRIAEFAEASARDVVERIPILFVDTLHRKGNEKTVKTPQSNRWVAIHGAFRADFMGRVERLRREHGEDAPLFPDLIEYAGRRSKDASNKVNAWLDKQVKAGKIEVDPDRETAGAVF